MFTRQVKGMSLYITRALVSYARGSSKKQASQMSTSVEQVFSLYTTFAMASEIMTTSLLDRLTSKGHILEFVGESYRFRQRKQLEEQAASEQAR